MNDTAIDLDSSDETIDGYEIVDLLASDFLARYREGDRPTVEEYARRHPELSCQIRKVFPLVLSVEKLKISQQTSVDGSVTLAGRNLKRFGDFTLIREIGRGGMGIVFEAEQESLGRRVAIKVLPKQSLLDDQAIARFQLEAKTAAAMHHSNIVPIFGTGNEDGTHFLVMQLVGGQALDKLLHGRTAPMSDIDVAHIGKQIADALAYAHAGNVLHRDVKPANILIEVDGTAQITDFGLARNTSDDPTETRSLSGSMRYMAPERFRGVSDERCDIYSLGLTLYEMLTGEPAFAESDPHHLMDSIKNAKPKSIRRARPRISSDLETIVLKAIHVEPTLRYATAVELREDLDRFLADEPIQARRISSVQRAIRWCRRNPKLATASSAAAVGLVIATFASTAGYWFTSSANHRTSDALQQSEQTVSLALQSLNGVVDVVSIPASAIRDVRVDEIDQASFTLNPSPNAARVLESIQPLYERLSKQSPTRPDIITQMTEASIRLAQIQHQLGRTTNAIETLKHSIELLGERSLESQLPRSDELRYLARLQNELGGFYSTELRFEAADRAHEEAIASAELLAETDLAAKHELARAHVSLGDPPLQRRQAGIQTQEERRQAIDHLEVAGRILEPFRKSTNLNESKSVGLDSSIAILNARIRLALSRLVADPNVKRQHFDAGILLLENQLITSEDDSAVRFALVEALSDVKLRRDTLTRKHNFEADRRLHRALVELEPLRKRFPEAPIFAFAESHILHSLSAISKSDGRFNLAEQQLLDAIAIQDSLVRSWPQSTPQRCWRAMLYRYLGEVYLQKSQSDKATQAIANAFIDLDAIESTSENHPFVARIRQSISDLQVLVSKEPRTP